MIVVKRVKEYGVHHAGVRAAFPCNLLSEPCSRYLSIVGLNMATVRSFDLRKGDRARMLGPMV